jgi:hypothetical protein
LIKKEKPLVGRDVFSKIKLKLKLKLKIKKIWRSLFQKLEIWF